MNQHVRAWNAWLTGSAIFVIGFLTSLAGDACHVLSGTTRYTWPGVPTLGASAIWFPFLVGAAIWGCARAGAQLRLPARRRARSDVVPAVAAVLALYALTAVLRGQPQVIACVLCASLALLIAWWWDPSPVAFALALGAALLGPLAEIGLVAIGAATYAPDADGLLGVAPWLPCLYFAAGAVASGLWRTLAQAS